MRPVLELTVVARIDGKLGEHFVLAFGEFAGSESGAGAVVFCEHWQAPPCEPGMPLQQQWQGPLPQQPHWPFADKAACRAQQECRGCCDRTAQRGHLAAGAELLRLAFNTAGWNAWSPQAQAIKGRDSAGTSMAASHTSTLAKMLSQRRTNEPLNLGSRSGLCLPVSAILSTHPLLNSNISTGDSQH
jgi:hypothetical protein